MARPKSTNSRRSKAERRKLEKLLAQRIDPTDRILRRREQFAFLRHDSTEGRGGAIDQDVCDAIGQLKALGLLDGHGHDAMDLRNVGREYAELYWDRYSLTAPATGGFERTSRGTGEAPPRSRRDDRFDKLDGAMSRTGMERTAIHMLLTAHYHSDGFTGWAQRLIDRALAERGVSDVIVLLDSATRGHDLYTLGCAVRGLCALLDASLPSRYARAA